MLEPGIEIVHNITLLISYSKTGGSDLMGEKNSGVIAAILNGNFSNPKDIYIVTGDTESSVAMNISTKIKEYREMDKVTFIKEITPAAYPNIASRLQNLLKRNPN